MDTCGLKDFGMAIGFPFFLFGIALIIWAYSRVLAVVSAYETRKLEAENRNAGTGTTQLG